MALLLLKRKKKMKLSVALLSLKYTPIIANIGRKDMQIFYNEYNCGRNKNKLN